MAIFPAFSYHPVPADPGTGYSLLRPVPSYVIVLWQSLSGSCRGRRPPPPQAFTQLCTLLWLLSPSLSWLHCFNQPTVFDYVWAVRKMYNTTQYTSTWFTGTVTYPNILSCSCLRVHGTYQVTSNEDLQSSYGIKCLCRNRPLYWLTREPETHFSNVGTMYILQCPSDGIFRVLCQRLLFLQYHWRVIVITNSTTAVRVIVVLTSPLNRLNC